MSYSELTQLMLRWGVISLSVGAGLGLIFGAILLIRQFCLSALDSVTRSEDFIGQMAVVILPFRLSQTGQVRMTFQGQTFDRRAKSYREANGVVDFRVGDVVLVVDIDDNHVVWVIPDWTRVHGVVEAS